MSDFSKEEYRLIIKTMMAQIKYLSVSERVLIGDLINKLYRVAEVFEEKGKIKEFLSLDDFFQSIEDHNKSIEGPVTFVNEDNPFELRLGWVCVESRQKWELPIKQIKQWENNSERARIFRKCTTSIEGRRLLCEKLSVIGKEVNNHPYQSYDKYLP